MTAPEGGTGRSAGAGRRSRRAGVLVLLVVVVAAAAFVRAFVAEAYYIPSASMEPGLRINDRIVVSRLAYDLHAERRGDVVVFDAPPGVLPVAVGTGGNPVGRTVRAVGRVVGLVDTTGVLVKRVIGLPGETVEGRGGYVEVDGRVLLEPYLAPGTRTADFGPVTVPAGHLWVMGDNRGDSEDSRVFGPIRTGAVVGRAVWRVWPPTRLSLLDLAP